MLDHVCVQLILVLQLELHAIMHWEAAAVQFISACKMLQFPNFWI
jgi:hypothetical protein